jgi:hypothetical protein
MNKSRPNRPPNMQRPSRRILNDIRRVCLNHYRNGEMAHSGQSQLKRLWRELEVLRGRRFGALDVRGLRIRLQRPDFRPMTQRAFEPAQTTVDAILSRLTRIGT